MNNNLQIIQSLQREYKSKLERLTFLKRQLDSKLNTLKQDNKLTNVSVSIGPKSTGMNYLGCVANNNGNGLKRQDDMGKNIDFEMCKQRAEDLGSRYFSKVGQNKNDFPDTPWSNDKIELGTCPDGYTLESDILEFNTQQIPNRISGGLYLNSKYLGYNANTKKWEDGVNIEGKFVDPKTKTFYNLKILAKGNTLFVDSMPSFNRETTYKLYRDDVKCIQNNMPTSCPGTAKFGIYDNKMKYDWANYCKTSWYNKNILTKNKKAELTKNGINAYISNNKTVPGISIDEYCYVGSNYSGDPNQIISNKCTVDDNNKNIGNNTALAIYELKGINNELNNNIGKVGYIDESTILHEYPNNMIELDNTYSKIQNYDSVGNNLNELSNVNSKVCKNECDKIDECYGFVYNRNNKKCFIKNKNIYPNGLRIKNDNADIYIRNKKVKNDKSCIKTVKNIDVKSWNGFRKGSKMKMDTLCGIGKELSNNEIMQEIEQLDKELNVLSKKINAEIQMNANIDKNFKNTIENDKRHMNDIISEYNKTKQNISNNLNDNAMITTYDGQQEKSNMLLNMKISKLILYSGLSAMLLFSIIRISKKSN